MERQDNDSALTDELEEIPHQITPFSTPYRHKPAKKTDEYIAAEKDIRFRERGDNSFLWVNSIFNFPRNLAQVAEVVCWGVTGMTLSQLMNSLHLMGFLNIYTMIAFFVLAGFVIVSYLFLVNSGVTLEVYRNIQLRYFLFFLGFGIPFVVYVLKTTLTNG